MSRRRRTNVIDDDCIESSQEEQSKTFKIENQLRDLQAMISNSLKAVIDTGADLAESGEYEESQDFGGILKELLKMDQRISMELARSEEFGRSLMMREGLEEASRDLEEFKALKDSEDNSIKWSENSLMKEYNEITWECGPGYGNRQGYPLIVNEDGGEEEFSVQVRDSLICPISQGQMKEPVKNSSCNHSYSKEMIERLFIGGQQTISCPVSGCRGVVQKRNLERDENLERKISKIEMRIFNK